MPKSVYFRDHKSEKRIERMDSSPMTVVQDSDPATTVTIHTDPTGHELVDSSNNIARSGNGSVNIVQEVVQGAVHTSANQSSDWLIAAANSLQVATHITTEDPSSTDHQTSVTAPTVMGIQAGDWISGIKGTRFHDNGKYITGYVDTTAELTKVLDDYQAMTGTSFPTMQQLSLTTKSSEDEYLQQRFLTPSARPRLFWQNHAGEPIIPFDGVPFISVGQGTEVPCVQAGRRKTTTQLLVATGDVLPTKIRTQGCLAKVSIRRILRYPSSRLPDIGVQGITTMRRLRKQVLDVLTAKICAGVIKPSERYYFSLPTPLAHDTHIVPEIEDPPSLIEPVHDEILSQIRQGITSTGHIQEHIKKFVNETYRATPSIDIEDPTFNPSRYELARYIYWLYKSGRAIDQECPFRERYSILNDEPKSVGITNSSTSIDTASPQQQQQQQHEEDSLAALYSITTDDSTDIQQISLGGATAAPTQVVGAEETTSTTTIVPLTHDKLNDVQSLSKSGPSQSPMLMATPKSSIFDSASNLSTQNEQQPMTKGYVKQSQEEVRCILKIIENQTYACNNTHALQVLRRQLTSLCTELSMHLAGTPKRPGQQQHAADSNSAKRYRLH